ncbi:GtrA family protein [[Clostridium] hylemonae]|uniref:GtrA-like protein n=1 Tax=[Clostridium] hylemonae DSM 15053 TaxID=553973 RepID=C0C2E5_9FIRM|nr:GtrA family protein [[Clostridium] hylemonae]EEG73569.1 GtrA-like protein [[Clostridium] hylemonae DSM 15053]QEK17171.1 hypothetical protein LAJLEIBI_01180 [[Clostridium] hylemonae DSM 15053]
MMKNIGIFIWRILENIVRFIIIKIFHMKLTDNDWDKIEQFIRFGIVGFSNTIISYSIYAAILLFLQKNKLIPRIDYILAQFIAFSLSVLWSFYWNRKCVFNAENENIFWPRALLKTYISYGFTGIVLNSILSIVWVRCFGMPKIIAPIINLLISVPLNFVLNKFWAFKKNDD